MKAEPADQAKLLDLQELDNHLAQVSKKTNTLPEATTLEQLSQQLSTGKEAQREALAQVDEITAELKRAESDVELVEARITKDTERLQQSTSAKDAQGLEHELHSLQERLSVLEEVELAVMERLEQAQKELSGAEQAVTELLSQVEDATTALNGAKSALEQDYQETMASRTALVDTIPQDLVALYERQRERYGFGASHLRQGISSASGVALTESDLATVRAAAADDVVLCPDSNAILVRTGESGL
jgi:predicted  nucleic acid-binding Zn-ribbon protein